jgi:hypothetical protein
VRFISVSRPSAQTGSAFKGNTSFSPVLIKSHPMEANSTRKDKTLIRTFFIALFPSLKKRGLFRSAGKKLRHPGIKTITT